MTKLRFQNVAVPHDFSIFFDPGDSINEVRYTITQIHTYMTQVTTPMTSFI